MISFLTKALPATFLLYSSLILPSNACTTVLAAAKSAYDSQINFMRRGLTSETTISLYAEFIANLAARAWETGPVGSAFGNICIPDLYLSQLQSSSGALHASIAIDSDVASSGAKVALMTETELAGLTYPSDAADAEWALTSEYLMEDIPLVLNISRLVFPKDGDIRVDPYQSDACYQFEQRYSTTGLSTVSASNWTANVLSMVLNLIDMGANATKALQLLKHATAYTNVGVRCYGVDKSELQVPMVFLTAYARQSAWLSENKVSTLNKDSAATALLYENRETIELLSSFPSGGHLPSTIISANGHLVNISFDWISASDAENTFRKTATTLPTKTVYFERVESSVNAAISAVIANENDLAFSISRKLKVSTPFWPVSRMGNHLGEATSSFNTIIGAIRRLLRMSDSEPLTVFPTYVRQPTCGTGWVFYSRPGQPNALEECCAGICITGAAGLSPTDAAQFTEVCCDACNEYSCVGGEQAAGEGAAEVVGITLPAFGGNENESIPVMI